MPQQVPEFRFSEDALRLRQFLYEHWCAHGHGPNLRAANQATGLPRALTRWESGGGLSNRLQFHRRHSFFQFGAAQEF